MSLNTGNGQGEAPSVDEESSGDWSAIARALAAEAPEVKREADGILRELLGRVRERKAMQGLGLSTVRRRGAA